jgi:hypothetical protein
MIKIIVNEQEKSYDRFNPPEIYGKPYGEIYVMKGVKIKDDYPTYFLCTGHSSAPIMIWYDNDEDEYKLSIADLQGYAKHIYLEKINAIVTIELDIS